MKFFVTNYSQNKLDKQVDNICLHYYQDCNKLNAPYTKDDLCLPNSGVTEMEINDEKKFEILKMVGIWFICPECEFRSCAEEYDRQSKLDGLEGKEELF
ncbi:hypothetical protein GCM10027592_53420 [Spirosoma flavus]